MDRRLAPLGIGLICVALTVGTVTSSVAAPPDTTSTVTVTTGAIPSRVDELFSGSLNAAERIHDEYASAAAKADSPPDTRAFWGYDRDAFERRASDLLDELAERFPDSFAGGCTRSRQSSRYCRGHSGRSGTREVCERSGGCV